MVWLRMWKLLRLTSEGWSPEGTGGAKGDHIDVMITNFCPDWGWCAPVPNKHGFKYHFDLMNCNKQITNRGWNNPVVSFIQIPCTREQINRYNTCECHGKSFLQIDCSPSCCKENLKSFK